jgi:nondiscriminating aspartyl-tRNA synthetase
MKQDYVKGLKSSSKEVTLKGWVYEIRDLAKLKFVLLRDRTGIVQCIVKDEKIMNKISGLTLESAVEISGKVKSAKVKAGFARDDVEIEVTDLEIISKSKSPLPIHVNEKTTTTEFQNRLDNRFLDIRKPKVQAIFEIQSSMMNAYRDFMINEEGALEAVFPSVIGASSEGGTELYKMKYFEKDAYLSQSCQLYKQMIACSLEKVFTIFTVWRAEKHNTPRHLNESRQFDYEQGFADEFAVMDVLARCVQFIVKKVLEKNKKELEILGVNLEVPKTKYLTFAEANDLLKKKKVAIEKNDLTGEGEKKLGELFPDTIVFVHDWPIEGKPFYIMPKEESLSGGFDAIYNGMEISSGGQRVHIPEILEERLKVKGLNPKDFKSYIDSFRYGAPPHAGWGMGLERLTMLMLGLENIREAVLFPRDRTRLTP